MERQQASLLSRFPRASGGKVVTNDGRIVHAEDYRARMNRMINQTLGRKRMALRMVGAAPVELDSGEESQVDEVSEALAFARQAS